MTVVSHMESPLNIVRNQQRLGVFPACEKRRVNCTDGDRCVHSRSRRPLLSRHQVLRVDRVHCVGQLGCDVEDS